MGIHITNSGNISYELKVNYLKYAYDYIRVKTPVRKGFIGVTLDLIVLGVAKTNYKLNPAVANQIEKSLIKSGGTPEVLSNL